LSVHEWQAVHDASLTSGVLREMKHKNAEYGDPHENRRRFAEGRGNCWKANWLTEEMIAQLGQAQPSRLRVIARTSIAQYKHTKEQPIAQIGRELGVHYILEGSVQPRRFDGILVWKIDQFGQSLKHPGAA